MAIPIAEIRELIELMRDQDVLRIKTADIEIDLSGPKRDVEPRKPLTAVEIEAARQQRIRDTGLASSSTKYRPKSPVQAPK